MIRDVHLGSRIRILIFTHPGSRIQGSKGTGSRIWIRNIVSYRSLTSSSSYSGLSCPTCSQLEEAPLLSCPASQVGQLSLSGPNYIRSVAVAEPETCFNYVLYRNRNHNKMESQEFSQTHYKIVCLISFIKHLFHTHFIVNLIKLNNFFPCKKAKVFVENCFL
jgi:hypothetical protein